MKGEHCAIYSRGMLAAAQDHSAARASEDFVRRRGDDVGVRNARRYRPACHQSDEVGGVDPQDRTDLVCDRAEGCEVDGAGVRGRAGDDDFRLVRQSQGANLVVVDQFGGRIDVIGNGGEPLPRKADARPVSQMPTVRQTHRQYGVAGLGECGVHREIRSGPRMRLDVDVLGAEQRLCPIDRQILATSTYSHPP